MPIDRACTRLEIIEALQAHPAEAVSALAWRRADLMPVDSVVRRHFGTWAAARRAAGLVAE